MAHADPPHLHLLVGTARDAVFAMLLERLGADVRVDREVTADAFVARALRESHDAYLIDQQLSPAAGDLLRQLASLGKDPVVIVGSSWRELAEGGASALSAEAVPLDATDARGLARLLRRLVERARLARQVRLPREVLEGIVERAPVMVAVLDGSGHVVWINREQERVLGWADRELRRSHFQELCGSDAAERTRATALLDETDGSWQTLRVRRRDGRAVETAWLALRLAEDAIVLMGRDVTEQREQTRRLAQAEKLEAIGRLSGGIAHDFNNLLTVIAGNAQLVLDGTLPRAGERTALEEVARAAESASTMVKQLLAFSSRVPQPASAVDLNAVISGMRGMVARLIGSGLTLDFEFAAGPCSVRLDVGHIEQIVLNLLLNARDATPAGGRVHVRTGLTEAAPAAGIRRHRVRRGRFVTLSVTDSGRGMDAETRQRVFEPFFTTRAAAGGTGLGLASVHAIVTQAGGSVEVASEMGKGTSFTVYLPAAELETAQPPATPLEGSPRAATVLVVEDHDVIRRLCRRVLEKEGHTVVDAANVAQALERASGMAELDVLLADVRLGGENGIELARTLRAARPALRVLLMSGHATPGAEDAAFLEKPFTPAALVSAVRQVLAREG